jgi:glycosyltransferase involved in cell wall biosynthesis
VIPNGVDVEFFDRRAIWRNYAIALGRICPEKGFHLALDAAKAADIPLLVAGEVFAYDAHRGYFDREIRPRLDGRRKFIGAVAPARKRRLLAGARCLLAPSLVQETSSLTAMEALACGTPVVARSAGALPEIVEHGRTGFIADTAEEMARAMREVDRLSREACRKAAETRFDARTMVARYFETWHSIASGDRRRSACSN